MNECPNHNGSFDCNPFCRTCAGEQEFDPTELMTNIQCPRCGDLDPSVLLDQDGEPYVCDECWQADAPIMEEN